MKKSSPGRIYKDFYLGFIKIHILHHTGQRPFFGQELKEELEEHGYSLSYGTLYPILHSLCREGYLEREDQNVKGRIRKYYSLTEEGRKLLEEAKEKIREIIEEVME